MSGLESIALAVAHLEEQREREQQQQDQQQQQQIQTQPSVRSSTSPPPPLPPPPPPRSSLQIPPARVVSTGESTPTPSKPITNPFVYILADPVAWLQKTQACPPLQPPEHAISKVESGDVLCGRGGETNHHSGNIQYRVLVKAFQPLYVSAKRREKPMIAKCIVYSVRQAGGRFLKRLNDKEWVDVGNTKAREKTSQALREGAPELRGVSVSHQPQNVVVPPQLQLAYAAAAAAASGTHQMTSIEATFLSAFLTPLQQALNHRTVNQHQHRTVVPLAPPHHVAAAAAAIAANSHITTTAAVAAANNRKRPAAFISDTSNSDSDSVGTTGSSSQGPRLKRFKKRLEEQQETL